MPSSRVRATNASKSSNVPRSGWIASCPPSGEPIAHGEPGSPGCGTSVLFRPLRNEVPIGCTGGRYTTSKPMSATASSRRAAVRSVPETGGVWPAGSTWAPSDRGKNSYHAPYSARSRSTCTVSARDRVTSSRSGHRATIAAMAGSEDPAHRRRSGPWRLGDPPRGPLVLQRALGEHQLHVLAGGDLDRRVVVPARDRVGPRLHVEAPQSLLRHGHVRAVAVRAGSELAHRRDRARVAVRVAQHRADADDAVALAEDRRAHLEGLPGHGLGRAGAAVHRRLDVKDRDSSNHPDYATDRGS